MTTGWIAASFIVKALGLGLRPGGTGERINAVRTGVGVVAGGKTIDPFPANFVPDLDHAFARALEVEYRDRAADAVIARRRARVDDLEFDRCDRNRVVLQRQ